MQEKENLEKNNEKFSKIEKEGKIIDSTNKENEYAKNTQSGKSRNKKQKGLLEKNKKKTIFLISFFICLLLLIFSTIFAFLNMNNSNIAKGVFIENVDISGMSKEDAKEKIEKLVSEKMEKEIALIYQDYNSSINLKQIEVEYDVEEAVEKAYQVGKSGNIFENNYSILKAFIVNENISIEFSKNEEITDKIIEDIGANLPDAMVQSSFYVEQNNLIITKGQEGIVVDKDKLKKYIDENLNEFKNNVEEIQIPVIQKNPEEIDINKIYEEIHKEEKDAYITKDPFNIYPEVEGVDFNIDEAKNILTQDLDEYIIELNITKPEVTVDKLGAEAFPDELSVFTTKYDASNINRSTNLRLASEKINGTVILAGETFSYNKVVGERTISAGYKEAKIYENGKVVDGLGGGICQISSTLYNAVLLSNLEIVERRNHQFVTSYVPAGRDATVVYGMTDFKFKNNRKYPIKISAEVKNGVVTIAVYGIKEENEYTINFETKTISTIPYTTRYIEDASLKKGSQIVQQAGTNGLKTETYMITSLNGKIVSKKLLSKDTYNAMERIVLKGTKN